MFIINAQIRNKKGKGENRRLRAANKFPGIIYGGKSSPIPIELDHDKIWNIQENNNFYSKSLILILDDRKETVKVQAVQRHAYKKKITHIDFIRIQR